VAGSVGLPRGTLGSVTVDRGFGTIFFHQRNYYRFRKVLHFLARGPGGDVAWHPRPPRASVTVVTVVTATGVGVATLSSCRNQIGITSALGMFLSPVTATKGALAKKRHGTVFCG
jgi:hypothetical protein